MTYSSITLDHHDFDALFTAVLNTMSDDFNTVHSAGFDITKKYPTAGFINGLARNSIVSPNVQE